MLSLEEQARYAFLAEPAQRTLSQLQEALDDAQHLYQSDMAGFEVQQQALHGLVRALGALLGAVFQNVMYFEPGLAQRLDELASSAQATHVLSTLFGDSISFQIPAARPGLSPTAPDIGALTAKLEDCTQAQVHAYRLAGLGLSSSPGKGLKAVPLKRRQT